MKDMDNIERYTLGGEIANAVTHGVGTLLSIAALVLLVVFGVKYGTTIHVVAGSIYGSSMILLYLNSTLYHSLKTGKAKDIFKIFDHIAIYFLIAGTYTPFALVILKGWLGWTLFGLVWGLTIIGIFFKIFFIKKFVILSTLLYIVMGWLIVFVAKPILNVFDMRGFILLALGGVSYTVGTIFYVWRGKKYNHMIWHLFVLAGTILQFFSVLLYVIPVIKK